MSIELVSEYAKYDLIMVARRWQRSAGVAMHRGNASKGQIRQPLLGNSTSGSGRMLASFKKHTVTSVGGGRNGLKTAPPFI